MLCAKCKGRLLCGRIKCPLLEKFKLLKSVKIDEKELTKPTPPSIFVGRIGYPNVYIGPMIALAENNPEFLDSPWLWSGTVDDVIKIRMNLIRGKKRIKVSDVNSKIVQNLQEVAASIKHVYLETELVKVSRKPIFDDVLQPIGISAEMGKIKITENPKIPHKVEKVIDDDLPADDAVKILFDKGFRTYYIQKLFSVGLLGKEKRRKLVPTRWSITAVHSILGEKIKEKLIDFKDANEILVFRYEHFGNKFTVVISPNGYNFSLIEIWRKRSFWSPDKTWVGYDSEGIKKKNKYSELGGGYYAARLPVLEYFEQHKIKGSVLVIREITPEYYAPIGVWVVEEGVRKAMMQKPIKIESKNEFDEIIGKEINFENVSKFINFRQSTLLDF